MHGTMPEKYLIQTCLCLARPDICFPFNNSLTKNFCNKYQVWACLWSNTTNSTELSMFPDPAPATAATREVLWGPAGWAVHSMELQWTFLVESNLTYSAFCYCVFGSSSIFSILTISSTVDATDLVGCQHFQHFHSRLFSSEMRVKTAQCGRFMFIIY